ncbi:MAG: ABC transporter permease [Parascardovia denticolens]
MNMTEDLQGSQTSPASQASHGSRRPGQPGLPHPSPGPRRPSHLRKFSILLIAELHRYVLELRRYLSNYISDLILTGILVAMMAMATNVRKDPTAWLGYFLWTASTFLIEEGSLSISTDKQNGTFTQLMLRPTSLFTQVLVKTLTWSLISIAINAIFIVGLFAVMRIPMVMNLTSLGLCLIMFAGLFGFTLIFVSLTVVYTRTQAYSTLFGYVLMLVSGVVVPLSSLPPALIWMGRILPLQYGIQLIQRSWTRPVTFSQWAAAGGQSLVYLAIGYLLFRLILKHGRKNGINMRY